jgi:hypothetical protein
MDYVHSTGAPTRKYSRFLGLATARPSKTLRLIREKPPQGAVAESHIIHFVGCDSNSVFGIPPRCNDDVPFQLFLIDFRP